MTSRLPSVSIVIPAYNEASVIRSCVESALHQTVPAYEIIVIDNNSTDDTSKLVRQLQREYPEGHIRLLHESQQGITPTRNHGFNHAKGVVIGRIDADSLIEPDWVEAVATAFADGTVDAATGPMSYHDMPFRKLALRADQRIRKVLAVFQDEYHYLFGSNMAIRTSIWHEVRAETCHTRTSSEYKDIDDEMFEDVDLSIHLIEHGYRSHYLPTMVANMSARRLHDSPRDFHRYVMRYERTYGAHQVRRISVRVPIVIYLAVYFPGKALQKWYERDGIKREALTLAELELKDELEEA